MKIDNGSALSTFARGEAKVTCIPANLESVCSDRLRIVRVCAQEFDGDGVLGSILETEDCASNLE